MKINKEQLERLLIAHWTEFINPREIINIITTQTKLVKKELIQNIKITRFEFYNNCFTIWIELSYNSENVLLEFQNNHLNDLILKKIV